MRTAGFSIRPPIQVKGMRLPTLPTPEQLAYIAQVCFDRVVALIVARRYNE
jgi:hypothetical protein